MSSWEKKKNDFLLIFFLTVANFVVIPPLQTKQPSDGEDPQA
jgi:hypothetical protein